MVQSFAIPNLVCTQGAVCHVHKEHILRLTLKEKLKKKSYGKAVKAPFDIGGRNTVDILFDHNSKDDGSGQVLSDLQSEKEDLNADAAFLGSMSAAGQAICQSMNQTGSVSNNFSGSSPVGCGTKPIPNIGCQVGRCINGAWEQVCN